MSGGSFEYLCFKADDLNELTGAETQIQAMADALAAMGDEGKPAAEETQRLLEDLRVARVRIETKAKRLAPVWRAVEWWHSCDISEASAREEIAKFNAGDTDGN